ncbi:MAG TPA: polysaccharide biosynthesis/export family protein, partial [Humisphaera sp.]
MRLSRRSVNRSVQRLAAAAGLAVVALGLGTGCSTKQIDGINVWESKSWIDPSELAGRVEKNTKLVPILEYIDPQRDTPNPEFATAQLPTAEDLQVRAKDYRISKNDLLSVEISDLSGPGTLTVKTTRVSESGMISLPYLPKQLQAEGQTEFALEQAIVTAYHDARIVDKAQVSVNVQERRGAVFNMLGAVNQPGPYQLVDPDFKVLDALALARETNTPLVTTMYIIRRKDLESPAGGGATPAAPGGGSTTPAPRPTGNDVAPPSGMNDLTPPAVRTAGAITPRILVTPEMKARPLGTFVEHNNAAAHSHLAAANGGVLPVMLADTAPAPAGGEKSDDNGRFVIVGGKRVPIGEPAATAPA